MAEAAVKTAPKNWSVKFSDPWLILAVLALTAIGLVMVYSASSSLALKRHMDSAYFFKRQILHVGVGIGLMIVLARMDYDRFRRWAYPFLGFVFLLLIAVLIPGVGHRAGGAARWLRILGVSIQPSELAKLALVMYMAYSLAVHHDNVKTFSRGFLPHLGMATLLVLPILAQPDLGMSLMVFTIGLVMMFVAGVRMIYLGGLVLLASPIVYALIVAFPYRFQRLIVFLDPWKYRYGAGFQIVHSFLAFGSGGPWGAGLGASKQKLFYLPEPHTDFIFSVLGEEMGLWGVTLVLGLFLLLVWRGIKTALGARDLFGTYLAMGATLIIGLQAFVNAGVVMGVLPTTGLTLPFISSGGSSMVVNFFCVGILLSVSAHRGKKA